METLGGNITYFSICRLFDPLRQPLKFFIDPVFRQTYFHGDPIGDVRCFKLQWVAGKSQSLSLVVSAASTAPECTLESALKSGRLLQGKAGPAGKRCSQATVVHGMSSPTLLASARSLSTR